MKRFLIILSVILFLFLGTFSVSSASNQVNAYLFYGQGCPHCANEIKYFETIDGKYSNLELIKFEVYHSQENSSLLQEVASQLNVNAGGVPFLVIGDKPFVGFSIKISPAAIESRIKECLIVDCPDSVAEILKTEKEKTTPPEEIKEIPVVSGKIEEIKPEDNNTKETEKTEEETMDGKIIDLPILGKTEVRKFSLPALTIILAFLDGFNPCAMWVLLFLVSLLFGIENRKRLWLFGIVFLLASAGVYFLFMTAWLSLFTFLGFIAWIRIAIGLLALASAYFNLKEYITNPDSGCKVTGDKKRRRIFEYLKRIIQKRNVLIALLGLIILAFAVNLVELVCSLGLPAVYVQILSLSNLTHLQYYLYLIFYVLVFILPATFVFFASAITLHLTGISTKHSRKIHLISGIIMLIIGILMIFKPEWLMFG